VQTTLRQLEEHYYASASRPKEVHHLALRPEPPRSNPPPPKRAQAANGSSCRIHTQDPAPTAELCDRLQDLERTAYAASPMMSTLR